MIKDNFFPELSEDQMESANSSIGVGDKVKLREFEGFKEITGEVVYAQMMNNHQVFFIKIIDSNGHERVLENVPQRNLRKVEDGLEEDGLEEETLS